MLSTVIWDIRTFLLVLGIVYFGFGEAFLRLSQNSDPKSQWVSDYAYAFVYTFRLSIGDTDTDNYSSGAQNVTAWIMFVLCVLSTNIIMLNLLIALISESFGKINSNAMSANYQERARLISENTYLIPSTRLKYYSSKNNERYIVVADEI
jgi:Ion transport protein